VVQMPRGELVNADKTSDPVHPQAPLNRAGIAGGILV